MTWINTITDSPNQSMILKLTTGDFVTFTLSYLESQKGWFYNLTYGNFKLSNRRITTCVNMLRAFRDLLLFGFACTTTDNYEPIFREDFANGRAKFFLLDSTDIQTVENMLARDQIIHE